jgi:hypothetical protein
LPEEEQKNIEVEEAKEEKNIVPNVDVPKEISGPITV